MPQLMPRPLDVPTQQSRDKAVRILARTFFRQLKADGYDARQILALSSELIGLVTSDVRSDSDEAP